MIYLPHRRLAFRGGDPEPPDQGNLIAWYKGDAGITLNGADISNWADQANGFDLAQGVGAFQPLLNVGGLNGMDTVLADTSEKIGPATITQTQPGTLYAIVKQIAWTSTKVLIGLGTGTFDGWMQFNTTPEIRVWHGSGNAEIGCTIGEWHVITTIFDNAGIGGFIQLDKGASDTDVVGAGNLTEIMVGAAVDDANVSNAEFAEILYYSGGHNAANRGLAQDYLIARWGL